MAACLLAVHLLLIVIHYGEDFVEVNLVQLTFSMLVCSS